MAQRGEASRRWSATWLVAAALGVAGCGELAPAVSASLWPEADALFHGDSRWIGADGAYSIDLGGGRVLWVFGDTFIATSGAGARSESKMIRNSLAIQTGYDPTRAFMRFYWPETDGEPQSFRPEEGGRWYWPAHGVRLDDALLVFYEQLGTPPGDPTGFANEGFSATLVTNPDDDPSLWSPTPATPPTDTHGAQLGESVVRDGDTLYLYATAGAEHRVLVARLAVEEARAGRFEGLAWWCGGKWSADCEPEPIIALGAPEFSVHIDTALGRWVMVDSQGYGATTLALRTAPAPEGPWTSPRDFLRPPESFEPDAFVYAGKAHPEIEGADLAVTYVPSSFADVPESEEGRYYYPRFVRMSYR